MAAPKGHGRYGGRTKGVPNKSTADIKALIDTHAKPVDLIKGLANIAKSGESEAARVAAYKELLDRRFGKASQVVSGDPDAPFRHEFGWLSPSE